MLGALLIQSFKDFEIIISDNASSDGTDEICARYAQKDARIRYFRQAENIGPEMNFKFVLDKARGPYFMWSACDDIRSLDFLEENIRFLEASPSYVASTSPNYVEGRGSAPQTFSIVGDPGDRLNCFFDNSWVSHGIFYALIRTSILRGCEFVGQRFLGVDWAIDLYLASRGNIHRTQSGMMVSGAAGISGQASIWRKYRTHWIGWLFPFHRVSLYAIKLSSSFKPSQRLSLMWRLLKLNTYAAYSQFHSEFYPYYSKHIRPWLWRGR